MSENSELFAAALAHHQSGELGEARALYGQVLQRDPGHADALHFLGLLACQLGQHDAGLALMGQSIEAHPNAIYYNNLGNMLCERGRLAEAIEGYREAVRLQPDYPEAHNNLGHALREAKQAQASMRSCAQAIALRPGYAEAYNNLGNALQDMGELEVAASSYERAIGLRADYAEAYINLCGVLYVQGKLDEALRIGQRATGLAPHLAAGHNSLGNICHALARLTDAAESYRRALALDPSNVDTHHNLAIVLLKLEQHDDALMHCRRSISTGGADVSMYVNMGDILRAQGNMDAAIAAYRDALKCKAGNAMLAYHRLLFCTAGSATADPKVFLAEARLYGAYAAQQTRPLPHASPSPSGRDVGRPLRVGFVSGDLRHHPVGIFLENVLMHIDPARVELIAYVTGQLEDDVTARLKPSFRDWRDVHDLSDEAAVGQIRADGIDVLLDLSGHTQFNRLSLFSWKPAPVQASWLGFFATTGCDAIDYVLGDRHVLPVDEEAHFVEKPWRLPDSYLCFTPPADPVDVGPLPMLANGGAVTFGCFGKLMKIGDHVVSLWSRLLHSMPDSRLFLKAAELASDAARQATLKRFAAHGIDASRLILEGVSARREYLATHNRVDIVLSPFPYPGGTTTAEALWMGVPVLCMKGDRFVTHICESLLQTAGLADWIAADEADYLAKAIGFASDAQRLGVLRAGLREHVLGSPLCDAPRFARNLEDAFHGMWSHYVASTANAAALTG